MIDSLKPGQQIRCTIAKDVRNDDARSTVSRLMRFDPDIKRKLKGAQEHRMKTLVVRSRGKRPWPVRRKSARYAMPVAGASWTMTFFPHIAPDFRAVASYLTIEVV